LFEDPRAQARHDARLRRAIEEVDAHLRQSPDDPSLHITMIRLHQTGGDDLFCSRRVITHARRAAELTGEDPEVLAYCGDVISFRGLIFDDIGLWKEGISLLRRAYALKPSSAYLHTLHSAFAHRP
jgi:hypothetical protein